MNLTEREKKVFREILNKGNLKEEQLIEAGYMESEIQEIKEDKEWHQIYRNVDNVKDIKTLKAAVSIALGDDWQYKYDFNEGRKRGKYHLSIYINDKTFDEICDVFNKERG